MKKNYAALIIVVLIFTISCASTVDLGTYNSVNNPEEDLVTLHISNRCYIERIDNYIVDKQTALYNKKIVKLNPGVHTFFTKYKDFYSYTTSSIPVTAKLEKGNMYFLDFDIYRQHVSYHIFLYNKKKKGKEVTGMPMENLIELDLLYSANVESPVSQGKSVKLENKNYTLVYKPNGVYTQTDKETGVTVKYVYTDSTVFYNSVLDSSLGKVFLFNADAEVIKTGMMGRMEINHEVAHTILFLINAAETEIVYQYEKPSDLKGTQITFNITKGK